jgi:hypothetical protein
MALNPETKNVTIGAGNALSNEIIDMSGKIGGNILVPAGWDAANLGFKFANSDDVPAFFIACDDTGVPIQISGITVGTAMGYAIPIKLFSYRFIQLWSKHLVAANPADVNQVG